MNQLGFALELDETTSKPQFPDDWPYHGRPSGHRYGCRCEPCVEAHRAGNLASRELAASGRTCKRCGKSYIHIMNSGTGTKYCASCKSDAYAEAVARHTGYRKREQRPCSGCGAIATVHKSYTWHLCSECRARIPEMMVKSLLAHRAPSTFVLQVSARPLCSVCDVDLRIKIKDNKGRMRYQFAIDHDHSCCPGSTSCGLCIRGLLCRHCNTAAGYLLNSAERAGAMARYLAQSTVVPDAASF